MADAERLVNGRIAVVSHRRDFDGIACAAELLRRYDKRIAYMVFTNPNWNEFSSVMRKLDGFSNGTVIITDLNTSADYLPNLPGLLDSLRSRDNTVIWIDHHPWLSQVVEAIKSYTDLLICGENPKCGAELVHENLCNGDETCRVIAELAHITDFNLKADDRATDEALTHISEIIALLDFDDKKTNAMRRELVEVVAEGKITGSTIDGLYAEYKKSESENIDGIRRSVHQYKIGRHTIGIAFSENLQSNKACALIKELTGSDIMVYVTTKDGVAHVRSDAGIDSSVLSRALGGNGHQQASGFKLKGDFHGFDAAGIAKYSRLVIDAATVVYEKQSRKDTQ
ncbi:MAG: hypothetical protein M1158_01635 [Candidatus Marsarchaeota archaeon]|nr:hypothetical protein [Candidatus Marsarchaeota archaeon]